MIGAERIIHCEITKLVHCKRSKGAVFKYEHQAAYVRAGNIM